MDKRFLKFNKPLFCGFMVLLLVFAFSCDKTDKTSDGTIEVVYIAPSTASQYWGQYVFIGVENAVLDLEEKNGIDINFTMVGPSAEVETDSYVKAFENVIAKSPDIIITGTLVPDATIDLVKAAKDRNIFVNFVGLGIPDGNEEAYGSLYYCDMGAQGINSAKAMLQALEAKGIEPKGKIGIHMSVITPALEPRMTEFVSYMKKNAPNIECLETLYNQNDVNNAQANAENQISTYGDELIGLYGANNVSGGGISLAIENANIKDKMAAITIDSDDLNVEGLQKGTLDAIIVQTPYEQGYRSMMNAYDYLATQESKDDKKVEVTAYVVTREDINKEEFQAVLDPSLNKRQ